MQHIKTLVGAAVLVAGVCSAGLMTAPAHALTVEICTDQGSASQCMNHAGGSYLNGAHVIGWSAGDPHNDFEFVALSNMCGHGAVTTTCPFTLGSGLNNAYVGAQIVAMYDPDNRCPGGTSPSDTLASLQPCPDNYGNNGGWSTINILEYAENDAGTARYVLVNKNFSNRLYANGGCYGTGCALIVGSGGHGQQIVLEVGDSEVQAGRPYEAFHQNLWSEGP